MVNNNKLNIIIDTNVIVSAFLSSHEDTSTVIVLKKVYNNTFNIYYSNEILAEYENVLNRQKFKFDKKEIDLFINFIINKGIIINPGKIKETLIDIKDLPFYEIVMDKTINDAKLITGNIKHFPIKPFIMTPTEFLKTFCKL